MDRHQAGRGQDSSRQPPLTLPLPLPHLPPLLPSSQLAHRTRPRQPSLPLPPPPPVSADFHWLLHLPPAFWSRMHHYLSYSEILQLSLLSTQFRHVQVENYLSWTVRFAAVVHRDREPAVIVTRRGQSQTCACYLCFRIRPIGQFQRPTDTFLMARVLQRDPYTGHRIFEPVTDPSTAETGNIVQPPSHASASPSPPPPAMMGIGSLSEMGGGSRESGLVSMDNTFGTGMSGLAMDLDVDMGSTHSSGSLGSLGSGRSSSMTRLPLVGGEGSATAIGSRRGARGGGGSRAAPGMVHGSLPMLQLSTPHGPVTIVSRSMWMPHAPGAEVGQIEKLRRYCIECALESHLLIPSDVTTTQTGTRLWVCRCRQARPETFRRCGRCQMNQVFRD